MVISAIPGSWVCGKARSRRKFDEIQQARGARASLILWFAKNNSGPNARVSISIATGFGRPGEAECGARNVVLHGSRPALLTCSLTDSPRSLMLSCSRASRSDVFLAKDRSGSALFVSGR